MSKGIVIDGVKFTPINAFICVTDSDGDNLQNDEFELVNVGETRVRTLVDVPDMFKQSMPAGSKVIVQGGYTVPVNTDNGRVRLVYLKDIVAVEV